MSEDSEKEAVEMSTDELREKFEESNMVEEAEEWKEDLMEHVGKIDDMEAFQMNIMMGDMEAAFEQMGLTVEEGNALISAWREKASEMAEEAGVFDELADK